jgi:alkanesulfonate monooxygenase SsuD/methylene tetrahydromethanopterin reductase-like flavin-dependent oxidoreductase (luciferase family)
MSEPAIRRAGRLADGLMAAEVTPATLADQVALARESRAAAGREDDLAVSVHLPTFAWNGDDAWERVRDHHRYVAWKYDDMDEARGRTGSPSPPPPLTPDLETELREQIVLGRPAEVAERIAEFQGAIGGDLHYIARLYWPGMESSVQREALAIFAEEVIPRLR